MFLYHILLHYLIENPTFLGLNLYSVNLLTLISVILLLLYLKFNYISSAVFEKFIPLETHITQK